MSKNLSRVTGGALALCTALLISGCGGGGGSNGSGSSSSSSSGGSSSSSSSGSSSTSSSSSSGGGGSISLFGVTANGDPLASATVMLKDQNGTTKTATTGSDGSFSIAITGLTSPFLLQAVSADGKTTLFSAATSSGTGNVSANIHPFTDLAVRAYFAALNFSSAATVFDSVTKTTVLPAQTDLNNLSQALGNALRPTLIDDGVVNPSAFNIFSTAFSANQTGFDLLLHDTTYTPAGSPTSSTASYVINTSSSNGVLVENDTVNAGEFGVGFNNSVSNTPTGEATITSSSFSNVTFPATTQQQQSDEQAAVTGIQNLFINLAAVVNARGSALSASDIAPFVDANYLDRGSDGAAFEQQVVQHFTQSSQTYSFFSVGKVYSFTETNGQTLIKAEVLLNVAAGSGSYTEALGGLSSADDGRPGVIFIEESNGSYEFYGDQTIAYMNLFIQSQISYTSSGPSNNAISMELHARAPFATAYGGSGAGSGTISSVSVSSSTGQLPDCGFNQPYTLNGTGPYTLNELLNNGNAVTDSGEEQFNFASCGNGFTITYPPPDSTLYGVVFNTPSGGSDTITAQILSQSSEQANLVSINGQSPATFLANNHVANVAGKTLTLTWTPPTTFAVEEIEIDADPADANGDQDSNNDNVSPAATGGTTLAIPAKLQNGNSTTSVHGSVTFFGTSGERVSAGFTIPQ